MRKQPVLSDAGEPASRRTFAPATEYLIAGAKRVTRVPPRPRCGEIPPSTLVFGGESRS